MQYVTVVVSHNWVWVVESALKPKGEPSFVAASMFQYWVAKADNAKYTPLSKLASDETIAHAVMSHARSHGVPMMSVRRLDAQSSAPKKTDDRQLSLFGDDHE